MTEPMLFAGFVPSNNPFAHRTVKACNAPHSWFFSREWHARAIWSSCGRSDLLINADSSMTGPPSLTEDENVIDELHVNLRPPSAMHCIVAPRKDARAPQELLSRPTCIEVFK
eukprot:CAMPEP_0119363888 /NCGR_PEP_ID=MMETSP1334-20130426/10811_1 /TAXON_ID=127549 /ORGANISM="Calcidiscus leptoporus, Strain RCC1130" /LENGTH=112 /DNA_ID=CAMNT_0007379461 /DNA_START=394 /DNA_END=733 /DNA_ORIENTATION=+